MPAFYRIKRNSHQLTLSYRNGEVHLQVRSLSAKVHVLRVAKGESVFPTEPDPRDVVEVTRATSLHGLQRRIYEHGFPVTDPRLLAVFRGLVKIGTAELMHKTSE